jgi:type I restriction enzyme M protein
VAARDVLKYDAAGVLVSANLDVKNPNAAADLAHLPPEQLAESILQKEQRIAEIMSGIKLVLSNV